jgi:hypothetical protein
MLENRKLIALVEFEGDSINPTPSTPWMLVSFGEPPVTTIYTTEGIDRISEDRLNSLFPESRVIVNDGSGP